MIYCNLCGAEKDNRRSMHGHLMARHPDKYRSVSFNMDLITTGAPLRAHIASSLFEQRPALFRRLKSNYDHEAAAIEEGFCFIDGNGELYTEEEAAEKGWI